MRTNTVKRNSDNPGGYIGVRVHPDVRKELERSAVEDHRTISDQVRHFIAESLRRRKARKTA